jgi:adenine-specific DNA glycosylase
MRMGEMASQRTLYLPKIQRVTIISTETASPKINPYTVYVAEVKLAGLNNHTVVRRYSEFMGLHEKLLGKYPNI